MNCLCKHRSPMVRAHTFIDNPVPNRSVSGIILRDEAPQPVVFVLTCSAFWTFYELAVKTRV